MRSMARSATICLSALACLCATLAEGQAQERRPSDRFGTAGRSKVIGGTQGSIRDWPYFASLRFTKTVNKVSTYVCGGTAIAPEWVLTAAHCLIQSAEHNSLESPVFGGLLEVVFGNDDLLKVRPADVYAVSEYIIHPAYLEAYTKHRAANLLPQAAQDKAAIDTGHDIALVKLRRPWSGALVRLSLAAETDPGPANLDARVAGFGLIDASALSLTQFTRSNGEIVRAGTSTLQTVKLPTVATDQCRTKYQSSPQYPNAVIGAEQICAGTEAGGKDSCSADSGGPLMGYDAEDQKYQVGLVSWGGGVASGCADAGWYGIYTRVSAYKDWISGNVASVNAVPKGLMAIASASPTDAAQSPTLTRAAVAQLTEILSSVQHQVEIALPSGPRLKLGDVYHLQVTPKVSGRLVLVDIDAAGTVTQIFPNQFTADANVANVRAGQTVRIPPADGSWRLGGFKAVEPLGTGQLIALVVPEAFPMGLTVASPQQRSKGLAPVEATPYLMNLVQQVEQAAAKSRSGSGAEALKGWALGNLKYEIGR